MDEACCPSGFQGDTGPGGGVALSGVVELRQYLSIFAGNRGSECDKHSLFDRVFSGTAFPRNNDPSGRPLVVEGELITLHQRTGEVEECRMADTGFSGLLPDDLLAEGFMERVHVNDRPACLGAFSRVCHEGEEERLELRLRCPSDKGQPDGFIWVEFLCSRLELRGPDENSAMLVACIGRDITRFKQREEELVAKEQAARDLYENNRRYLTTISHALRTPLNAIIGFSDMMNVSGVEDHNREQVIEYAGIINDSGRHLLGVVDEVRDMSQFDPASTPLDPQTFRVTDLVSAALELVQFEAEEKGVRFIVADLDESLRIHTDFRVCKQALMMFLAARIREQKVAERVNLHLSVSAQKGNVSFLIAGCETACDAGPVPPFAGPQLRTFVEFLSAEILLGDGQNGLRETIFCVPSNLDQERGDTNVVPISQLPDAGIVPERKTA